MVTRPNFQMSSDARLIYQRLRQAAPGEVVKHGDVEAAVSRPLSAIRGSLATALRRVLKDDGMVFANIRGVGYLRCQDEAIVDQASADTAHIRRAAKRAGERLTKVADYAALPPAKQLEHTTRLSVVAAICDMTRENAISKVRAAAQGRSGQLPLVETIRAFLP
jgi:DNA-binding winged helix-turn-helix (wHTH) protein